MSSVREASRVRGLSWARGGRVLAFAAAALLLVLAVIAGTLYALGTRGIADLVLARIAPVHAVDSVTRLPNGDLLLRGLHLRGETWRVDARNVRITPDWDALARGEVRLPRVAASGVRVAVNTRSPGPSRELSLPRIAIPQLQLQDLALQVDDTHLRFATLDAAFDANGTDLHLRRASAELFVLAEHLRLRNTALDVALTVPRAVHLRGRWTRVHASGPASGALDLNGAPADLRGVARIDTPLPVDAAVVLRHGVLGAAVARLVLGNTTLAPLLVGADFTRRPMPILVNTLAEVPGLGNLRISGRSAWTGAAMPIDAQVFAGPNSARLQGTLDPGRWQATLALDGKGINAAHWVDGAKSALHVTGRIDAHVLPPLQASIALRATGELLARPVRGETHIELDAAGLQVVDALLSNRENALRLAQRGSGFDATWRLGNLATLSTRWAGRVTGRGSLRDRRVDFTLDGRNVGITGIGRAGSLQASGHADLDRRVDISARARDVSASGMHVDSLAATVRGTPAQHEVTLTAVMPDATLDARARGAWRETVPRVRAEGSGKAQGGQWHGQLDALTIATPAYGRWRLRAPAAANVSLASAAIAQVCLDGGAANAYLCIDNAAYAAAGRNAGPRAHVRFANLPLAMLPLARLEAVRIEGHLDGEFDVDRTRIDGSLHADDTVALLNRRSIAVEQARATVHWPLGRGAVAAFTADVRSSAVGEVTAEVRRAANGELSGHIDAGLRDLGFVQALVTDTRQFFLEGKATIRLELAGTDSAPRLGGDGQVLGRLRVPTLGIGPMPLALALHGDGTRATFDGKLGGMALAGALGLASLTEPTLDATLRGSKLRLVERQDLVASLSPDLQVTMRRNLAQVGGKVTIDAADIRFATSSARQGGLSDDVVIHPPIDPRAAPPRATPATPTFNWTADVQVQLGDAVQFMAAGLKTRLQGQLRVQARPPQPLRVLGYVNAVEGSFDTYGVRLAVERGRLDFNGPADNPRVDARATRKLNDAGTELVGVRITGPLQRMNTQLFSEPPRTAEDTLALLVTGQSLAASSDTDLRAVGEAGLALGVLDALPVTSVLRESLGLDELEVRNPLSRDAGEVRIGKQITRRLRARYVYSVFNRTGGLQLRYQVTDRLSLQTEAGAETSAIDVLWEWKSDTPARAQ